MVANKETSLVTQLTPPQVRQFPVISTHTQSVQNQPEDTIICPDNITCDDMENTENIIGENVEHMNKEGEVERNSFENLAGCIQCFEYRNQISKLKSIIDQIKNDLSPRVSDLKKVTNEQKEKNIKLMDKLEESKNDYKK